MKSSYKIALLIAAVLLVFGVGYYLSQNGSDSAIEDAERAATGPDRPAQRLPRSAPPADDADEPASASDTDTGTDTDADGATAARSTGTGETPAADQTEGDGNPLLAELRASLAAAQQQPGGDDEPGAADSATDDGAPTTDGASPSQPDPAARSARANDTLNIDESAADDADTAGAASTEDQAAATGDDRDGDDDDEDGDGDTASASASASAPANGTSTTGASRTSTTGTSATGTSATGSSAARDGSAAAGPEPGVPYFGPLPGDDEASASQPAPTRTATRTTSQASSYEIQSGDTFASIAADLYGDQSRWVDIAQANPMVDPTKLQVGQQIRLPGASGGASSRGRRDAAEAAAGASTGQVRYTVRSSDTLSTIAQQFYGNAGQWQVIFDANRDVLGNNPDRIRAGQEIVIPPAPGGAR